MNLTGIPPLRATYLMTQGYPIVAGESLLNDPTFYIPIPSPTATATFMIKELKITKQLDSPLLENSTILHAIAKKNFSYYESIQNSPVDFILTVQNQPVLLFTNGQLQVNVLPDFHIEEDSDLEEAHSKRRKFS